MKYEIAFWRNMQNVIWRKYKCHIHNCEYESELFRIFLNIMETEAYYIDWIQDMSDNFSLSSNC